MQGKRLRPVTRTVFQDIRSVWQQTVRTSRMYFEQDGLRWGRRTVLYSDLRKFATTPYSHTGSRLMKSGNSVIFGLCVQSGNSVGYARFEEMVHVHNDSFLAKECSWPYLMPKKLPTLDVPAVGPVSANECFVNKDILTYLVMKYVFVTRTFPFYWSFLLVFYIRFLVLGKLWKWLTVLRWWERTSHQVVNTDTIEDRQPQISDEAPPCVWWHTLSSKLHGLAPTGADFWLLLTVLSCFVDNWRKKQQGFAIEHFYDRPMYCSRTKKI